MEQNPRVQTTRWSTDLLMQTHKEMYVLQASSDRPFQTLTAQNLSWLESCSCFLKRDVEVCHKDILFFPHVT